MSQVCGICTVPVDPEDHYRELDCSRKCEANVFHEPCIERYLRKHGHGTDQKTGFACPATYSNGKPCVGTIKKTHVRLPSNSKKKEQNRQAAIAVNLMMNVERGGATPVLASKFKDAVVKPLTAKTVGKLSKIAVVHRPTGQGVEVYKTCGLVPIPRSNDADLTATDLDDLSNFRQIGKRVPKQLRDVDYSGSESNDSELSARLRKRPSDFQGYPLQKSTPAKQTSVECPSGSTGWIVSKNSAMAPEPVIRQHTIPGLTEPVRSFAGASNLEQQRGLVAELRAKERMNMANRATSAAVASGGSRKVDSGKPGQLLAAEDSAAALKSAMSVETSIGRTSSFGDSSPTADLGMSASLVTPSSDTTSPASPAACTSLDEDSDPIVKYDQLFSLEDGSLIVMDNVQNGTFVRMQDLYGSDPEMVGFQDEAGNVTYYVTVRASVAAAAAAAACQLEQQLVVQQLPHEGMAALRLNGMESFVATDMSPHAAGAATSKIQPQAHGGMVKRGVDTVEEDDFEELLSLCLG